MNHLQTLMKTNFIVYTHYYFYSYEGKYQNYFMNQF